MIYITGPVQKQLFLISYSEDVSDEQVFGEISGMCLPTNIHPDTRIGVSHLRSTYVLQPLAPVTSRGVLSDITLCISQLDWLASMYT